MCRAGGCYLAGAAEALRTCPELQLPPLSLPHGRGNARSGALEVHSAKQLGAGRTRSITAPGWVSPHPNFGVRWCWLSGSLAARGGRRGGAEGVGRD